MAQFCRQCGSALNEGAKFCNACGASTAAATGVAPAPPAPAVGNLPPPPGAPRIAPAGPTAAPSAPVVGAAPYAPYGPTDAAPGSIVARGRDFAAAAAKSVPPNTAFGQIVQRAIRVTFLDPDAYHELAAKPSLNGEAALVAVASLASVAVGPSLFASLTGGASFSWILPLLAIQVVSMIGYVVCAAAASASVIGTKLDYGVVFRTSAYAQAVGILGIVPAVGSLLALWRVVTMTTALRVVGRCDVGKAIVLLIVGGIGGAVASMVLSPVISGMLGGPGGFRL